MSRRTPAVARMAVLRSEVVGLLVLVLSTSGATLARSATRQSGDERTLSVQNATRDLVVTVTEGPHEPWSIGSYAVRLYAPGEDQLPYDNFVTGTVRPRDGRVERLVFADIDDDGEDELVVISRSVGSGGYLAAEAFAAARTGLRFETAVTGPASEADPIAALRAHAAP